MRGKRYARRDVSEVRSAYPPGTRLFCPQTKKTYQIGVKFGMSRYWLMAEDGSSKGTLDAGEILRKFERLQP